MPNFSSAKDKVNFSDFEYYVAPDGAFGLYKPKGWKVGTQKYPDGRLIFVTDKEESSCAYLIYLERIDQAHDSVSFAKATLQNVKRQIPDLKVAEARTSRDRMKTVVMMERTGPGQILIKSKYTFNITRPQALIIGYEAPARHFNEMVPTLMTIIANIMVFDEQTYKKVSRQRGASTGLPPRQLRRAADGTCQLLVPQGWKLEAAQGRALCSTPDGDTGYVFTVIDFVGQSQIPYFSSAQIPGLKYNYMPPPEAASVALGHYGWKNQKILERHFNPRMAQQATKFLKRQADAEISLLSSTSKNGTSCIIYFDILGFHPNYAGQWGIIVNGFWAPQNKFGQYLPSLIEIFKSFKINEQWAEEYVRQGLENLKRADEKDFLFNGPIRRRNAPEQPSCP